MQSRMVLCGTVRCSKLGGSGMIDQVMVSAMLFNGLVTLLSLMLMAIGVASEGRVLVFVGLASLVILGG